MQAGQPAYNIAQALQQPGAPADAMRAALGQAMQRLLEGLRGADVLQGLPPELAQSVEVVEQELRGQPYVRIRRAKPTCSKW